MESWPTDFKANNLALSKKLRSRKETYRLTGQTLDVGSLGAATLALKDNSLEWKTLVQPPGMGQPRQIGQSVQMLPSCRPSDEGPAHQKAAERIKFFRTNYPDVDIPFELLQEEIQADEKELKEFDPYQGNKIAQLVFLDRKSRALDFIAIPVGKAGSDLNVFPIRATGSAHSFNFIPVSEPLIKFETPIRQLESFPLLNVVEKYSFLVVRTYGAVSMLKVATNRKDLSNHPLAPEVVQTFSIHDTDKHQVVDICGGLDRTSGQLLLVNDAGSVYLSELGGQLHPVYSRGNDSEDTSEKFWRVAWADINTYLRFSAKQAHLFDLRLPVTPTELFHLSNHQECITSFGAIPGQGFLLGFSTTSRLLLYDVRHMNEPVISLNHYRTFDRTLRLKSFNVDNKTWHALSSSQNRLVTAYNTASSSFDLVHLQGMHSILPSSPKVDLPIVSAHIFQESSNPGSPISYLQLSSNGSLWSTDITFTEQDSEARFLNPINNEALENLIEQSRTISSQLIEENQMESTEADFTDIYKKITQVKNGEEDRESFYQVLDKLPSFWQDTETPIDNILTTFDVAFQSGQEPKNSLRADFFTGSVLNSRRGLAALLNDRIPTTELTQRAPWSFDLASLASELVPDATVPPKQLFDRLTKEAVARETTDEGIKFAIEASQELVMDLALTRHIYTPRTFSDINEESNAEDNLLMATQALSLNSPPIPSHRFAYLQPTFDEAGLKEGEDKPEEARELLPGVRLLLSEWKAGTNPEDYVFKDWFTSASSGLPETEHAVTRVTGKLPEPSQIQLSQVPPVITRQPPLITSAPKIQNKQASPSFPSRPLYGGSQMDFLMTQGSGVSQEQYPNSQILSGPFGGQLNLDKKKLAKKRTVGF